MESSSEEETVANHNTQLSVQFTIHTYIYIFTTFQFVYYKYHFAPVFSPYKCLTCENVWYMIVKVHYCSIFYSWKERERGKKMKDFSCLSDILAYSPNDRFLTDQLYHLLLKLSNISLWNGFILISHLRDLELNPRHPLCV